MLLEGDGPGGLGLKGKGIVKERGPLVNAKKPIFYSCRIEMTA